MLVEAGATKPVYRLDVPEGSVAFIWIVANNPMPAGSHAEWIVDDERVNLPDLKIQMPLARQIAPFEKPLQIKPPIIAKKQVLWIVYSPIDYEYIVGLDGEIYTYTPPEQVIAHAMAEALKAVGEKPATILEPLTINVTDKVLEVKSTEPWLGFSLFNDGPSPVYIMVNEEKADRQAPLNQHEKLDINILTRVLYLVCDKGQTTTVRIYPSR